MKNKDYASAEQSLNHALSLAASDDETKSFALLKQQLSAAKDGKQTETTSIVPGNSASTLIQK